MSNVRTTFWLVGWAIVGIGGCGGASARLSPPPPPTPRHPPPPLRVDTLNVPASWDRVEILKPSAAGALQISDFDHWAAPLAQMARQTLSDDLDQRLPSGRVIYPRPPNPSGALGVNVDILEYNIVASQASMRASWIIVPFEDAQSAKRSAAELRRSMSSEDPAAVAQAWSDLIGQLADRIAAAG